MNDAKYEYFLIVEPVEEQMLGKSGDPHSPYVLQFRGTKCARRTRSRAADDKDTTDVTSFCQRPANRLPD
jgi:hypothetical protein